MTWVDWFFLSATSLCAIGSTVTLCLYLGKRTEQRKKQRVQNFARALDVRIIRAAAPKAGTILTPERMAENLRSLNQPWDKKKEE